MPLHLYNTLTKQSEVFSPLRPPLVTMYTCGPTVYGRPHIGNFASFLMADLLRRWLEVGHGYQVRYAKNITDVGHLVKDADSGEDKIEKQAREEHGSVTHESVIAIARKYEAEYLEDERALGLLEPHDRPRASEYVEQMKEMITQLLLSKKAYITSDGIYFSVQSFPAYGQLSGNTVEALTAGARVEVNAEKQHPADFALWKFCVGHNVHHALRWDSPTFPGKVLPPGFPGWHIECSAMSRALLGETIDLHTGGEDNIFPHHECEIAQSESVTGQPFVRHWLHKRRIDLAGEKMSKSLGNILTVPDIIAKGYSALDLRYYLLSVHYRTNLKFAWKGMDDARIARRAITAWIEREGKGEYAPVGTAPPAMELSAIQAFATRFQEAMDADLNTSGALAAIFECMHYSNSHVFEPACREALVQFTARIRATFGCFEPEQGSVPADVQGLLDERAQARANKDFTASDRLRDAIFALGYVVKDTKDGQKLERR